MTNQERLEPQSFKFIETLKFSSYGHYEPFSIVSRVYIIISETVSKIDDPESGNFIK